MANPPNARIAGENVTQMSSLNVKNNLYVQGNLIETPSSNVIIVRTAEELSGTLDSTKLYVIDGIIDFTGTGFNIEIPSTGLTLSGYSFDISKIICSDSSYTLFTSEAGGSGDLIGKDFAIEVTGASSQVYNITDVLPGNAAGHAIELERVNYNDCTSLGTISGYRQGLESGTGRFGGTPELTLAGTWTGGFVIDTSIVRALDDGAYTLFKAGAGFTMASRFKTNLNVDLPASASLLDFAAANFISPSTLQLHDVIASRNGVFDSADSNLTPNITYSDLKSSWVNSLGINNTHVGGKVGVTAEIVTVISASGTFYDLNGTYTAEDLQHFDNPALNHLRHLGNNPRDYNIIFDLTIDGNPNREVAVKVVQWDDSASSFIDVATKRGTVNSLAGGRDVAFVSDFVTGSLDQNDYFKLQVANNTDTGNLTVELDGFMRVEAR